MVQKIKFKNEDEKNPRFGVRHLQVILIFFSVLFSFACRYSISVTVVAMTTVNNTHSVFPTYHWNEQVKSYILSSFYWGYVTTPFLGGYLSNRFGPKLVILISALGTSLFFLLVPMAIYYSGWQAFCGLRIFQGIFQGVIFSAWNQHLANWCPASDRNYLGAFAFSASDLGSMLVIATSGTIAESDMGWPGISYIFGGLFLVWSVVWSMFSFNKPSDCKWMSAGEQAYMQAELCFSKDTKLNKPPIPWKAILLSVPLNALRVAHCVNLFVSTLLSMELPIYLNAIFDMEVKNNSLFSALPFLATWISSYVCVSLAELLMRKDWLSLLKIRKLFTGVGFCLAAICLFSFEFLREHNTLLAMTLFTATSAALTAATMNILVNNLELTPHHAGIAFGISNTISTAVSMLAPLLVGVVVYDETNTSQWNTIFIFAGFLLVTAAAVFSIWGRTETQPWNDEDYLTEEKV